MISQQEEIARQRVAEQIRAAELRAQRNEYKESLRAEGHISGPRHELAGVLRRLADRLEPQPRHRRTGLSVVR